MKTNDWSKEFKIKNRTCYYLDEIIKFEYFYFENILIDEKPNENVLVYNISYKTFIGTQPFRIRLDKIDEFIRVYDGTRYLVLFGAEKYDIIYNRIIHLIDAKMVLHMLVFIIMQNQSWFIQLFVSRKNSDFA